MDQGDRKFRRGGPAEPVPIRRYDMSQPARVLARTGALLWEGPDILDALAKLRELTGDRIERDGVLLAKSVTFTKAEYIAREALREREGE